MFRNDDQEKFNEIFFLKMLLLTPRMQLSEANSRIPAHSHKNVHAMSDNDKKEAYFFFKRKVFLKMLVATHRLQFRRRAKKFGRKTDSFLIYTIFPQKNPSSCSLVYDESNFDNPAGGVFLGGGKLLAQCPKKVKKNIIFLHKLIFLIFLWTCRTQF